MYAKVGCTSQALGERRCLAARAQNPHPPLRSGWVTSYHYFGARYYEPLTGRFSSIDKAGQFLSGYNYCGNDPILHIDPDGNEAGGIWLSSNKWDPEFGPIPRGHLPGETMYFLPDVNVVRAGVIIKVDSARVPLVNPFYRSFDDQLSSGIAAFNNDSPGSGGHIDNTVGHHGRPPIKFGDYYISEDDRGGGGGGGRNESSSKPKENLSPEEIQRRADRYRFARAVAQLQQRPQKVVRDGVMGYTNPEGIVYTYTNDRFQYAGESVDQPFLPDVTGEVDRLAGQINVISTIANLGIPSFPMPQKPMLLAILFAPGSIYDVKNRQNLLVGQSDYVVYNGTLFASDDIGNLLFGFAGANMGLPDDFLLFGAGMAQFFGDGIGPFQTYFDHVKDQQNIKAGILWSTQGRRPNVMDRRIDR